MNSIKKLCHSILFIFMLSIVACGSVDELIQNTNLDDSYISCAIVHYLPDEDLEKTIIEINDIVEEVPTPVPEAAPEEILEEPEPPNEPQSEDEPYTSTQETECKTKGRFICLKAV